MADTSRTGTEGIQDHMPVVGSDGRPFGTVDRIAGDYIRLTKSDPLAKGTHRYLPRSTVAGLDGGMVRLSMPAEQAQEAVLTEAEMEQRLALDSGERTRLGEAPDAPHGSRAHAHGGPKGQREHGTSGQAAGPGGRLSTAARNLARDRPGQ